MGISQEIEDLSLLPPLSEKGTIFVVSGWRGVGKTTYCQRVVEEYRKKGFGVSGLLSPGRYENYLRNGIFAIDLASHESRLAASLVPGEIEGTRLGPWMFDPDIFDWGNRCLLQSAGTDVLVIDELGYLEFDMKTGWTESFEVLRRKKFRLAIVVIRPECMEAFSDLGFSFQTKVVHSPQPLSDLTF